MKFHSFACDVFIQRSIVRYYWCAQDRLPSNCGGMQHRIEQCGHCFNRRWSVRRPRRHKLMGSCALYFIYGDQISHKIVIKFGIFRANGVRLVLGDLARNGGSNLTKKSFDKKFDHHDNLQWKFMKAKTRESEREKRYSCRTLNWPAALTKKKLTIFMGNENYDGHAKVWRRISSNRIVSYAGTFAMVLQWLAVIQLHRSVRPCHGVVSVELKKSPNYITNELVKISLFGFFCDVRNWFTCAFAHVTFTCRSRWRRTPHIRHRRCVAF